MEQADFESIFAKQWCVANNNFEPVQSHKCSMETCNVQHTIGGLWVRGSETHVCLRMFCTEHPKWATRGTLKKQFRNMYMCCGTGAHHWCDEQCSCTTMDHNDGGFVCRISGIRYDSVKSDTWFNSHRVTATHQENKDPLKLVRNTNFKINANSSDTIRDQQHIYISRAQVCAILFSNERLFMEQRKYVEMKIEAEKVVQKYLKTCEKQKQRACFTHIVQLYINQMNRRHIFRNLIPTDRSVDDVISHYATLTCKYWTLITRKFPLGKATPALFPIKVFVISIMYIMKGGLFLGGVQVIEKDNYLASILPEANTLDSYNINKPSFTACKNNILKAYRDASETFHVPPQAMVLQ